MSKKQSVLIVSPPLYEKDINGENFKFPGIECPTCEGTGNVPLPRDLLGFDPADLETCQRCGGTGRLKADVVIRWQADETVIE